MALHRRSITMKIDGSLDQQIRRLQQSIKEQQGIGVSYIEASRLITEYARRGEKTLKAKAFIY